MNNILPIEEFLERKRAQSEARMLELHTRSKQLFEAGNGGMGASVQRLAEKEFETVKAYRRSILDRQSHRHIGHIEITTAPIEPMKPVDFTSIIQGIR